MKITLEVLPDQIKGKVKLNPMGNLVLSVNEVQEYLRCPILWDTFMPTEQKAFSEEQIKILKSKHQYVTSNIEFTIVKFENEREIAE